MNKILKQNIIDLSPTDNRRLADLCGPMNEHLKQIEYHLGVEIYNRGHHFEINGPQEAISAARGVIHTLYAETKHDDSISSHKVHLMLQQAKNNNLISYKDHNPTALNIKNRRTPINVHNPNQDLYIRNIQTHDISFGVGPAGTGKTYLAVACAVAALEEEKVSRILLVRPAVEAGEKLGFLPGDFAQKVDPYFRPLYDALYEMLGFQPVTKLIETNIIEVVPLAYMRGRTLNDAFIILDEAQNTTKEQMKMFLTRIGFNSKVVVTGDITQTDLPKGSESGLNHTINVLKNIKGISFTHFQAGDVVRHPLVQVILEAYDYHETNQRK